MTDTVTLTLTHAEALVLSDLLDRLESGGAFDELPFEHDAERTVLWSVAALLERVLVEPFDPGYPTLVAAARDEVCPPPDPI